MQGSDTHIRFWLRPILGMLSALALLSIAASSAAAAPVAVQGATIFPLAPGTHATSLTVAPDGYLWFGGGKANFGPTDGKVGRITLTGQVIEFPLPDEGHGEPADIATGPDGNLWITERELNRVARITPSGQFTEFALPGDGNRPNGITVGPDGNLWFTEEATSKIGRITPDGATTEFSLRHGRHPTKIVAGPDGHMWFTERSANRIGKIATSGEVTEFVLSGANRRPSSIVVGSDRNLWFTEGAANQIGRITSAGEITQFPVPVLTGTTDIAAGPDGNLWFTTGVAVGSISPSGVPGQRSCIDIFCRLPVISLATGTGGDLWFGTEREILEYGGGFTNMTATVNQPGYVGKLSPQSPTVAITPNAKSVAGRLTAIGLRCEEVTGCHGVLQVTRRLSAYPRGRYFNPDNIFLGQRRYELAPGESKNVRLRLTRRASELLLKRHTLPVWAAAGEEGQAEATQSIILHQRAKHGPTA